MSGQGSLLPTGIGVGGWGWLMVSYQNRVNDLLLDEMVDFATILPSRMPQGGRTEPQYNWMFKLPGLFIVWSRLVFPLLQCTWLYPVAVYLKIVSYLLHSCLRPALCSCELLAAPIWYSSVFFIMVFFFFEGRLKKITSFHLKLSLFFNRFLFHSFLLPGDIYYECLKNRIIKEHSHCKYGGIYCHILLKYTQCPKCFSIL